MGLLHQFGCTTWYLINVNNSNIVYINFFKLENLEYTAVGKEFSTKTTIFGVSFFDFM